MHFFPDKKKLHVRVFKEAAVLDILTDSVLAVSLSEEYYSWD